MQILSTKPKLLTLEAHAVDFTPVHLVEIELEQPLPLLSSVDEKTGRGYQRTQCLIRLHTCPIGLVEIRPDADGALAEHIWNALGVEINEHLRGDGLEPVTKLCATGLPSQCTPLCIQEREQLLGQAPFVSVIVPTHNRPERLQRCLHSLLALHYLHYEVIVVDNAPDTNASAEVVQHIMQDAPRVRYVREDRPGPAWARNCGIQAARGELLAFADDDVVVDPYWLIELVRGFSVADNVVCVTGLVLPQELETPAQLWFEEYGGFSKGFTRRIYDMREHRPRLPLYPYTIGLFGTGASMAFTAAFLHSVNGFDLTLGDDGPARGSEDTAMFFQVITKGHRLVYTPTAPVYHPHHRDYTNLQKQVYRYGIGLTAFLMKCILEDPRRLLFLLTKASYGLSFIMSSKSSKNKHKTTNYPKDLTMLELKGMFCGPFNYLWSRWVRPRSGKTEASMRVPSIPPVAMER